MKTSPHFEKKKAIPVTLSRKQRVVFAGLVLVIVLASIILFISAFGGINYLPDKILKKSGLQNIAKFVSEKFSVLGQELPLFFFPHFPQRLMYVSSEISRVSEELVSRNQELLELTSECDCQFAESQCRQIIEKGKQTDCKPGPVKVFGEPCPQKEDETDEDETETIIEGKQAEIHDLTMTLTFLENLLKEEMDAGLEKQLQTLREDDAKILRDNLENLKNLSPQIASPAKANLDLPDQCSVAKCSPECQPGKSFSLEGCINIGQQKPIEIKFGASVALEDIEPGKIGIKSVNLNLPEKIEMPALPELPALTISIPDITLTCPNETRSIAFNVPSPSLPEAPTLTLSCPIYPDYPAYRCSAPPGEESESYIEAEWFSQTFSYLSEKCLDVIYKPLFGAGGGEAGMDVHEKLMKACLHPTTVAKTIYDECDKKWYHTMHGWELPDPSGRDKICEQIGHTIEDKYRLAAYWCRDLFRNQITPSETPPPACSSNPKETIKQKCNALKAKRIETVPFSCKIFSLFPPERIELEYPLPEIFLTPEKTCPSAKIGDYPDPAPGCSFAFPSLPKISFPQIIVPDIRLPSFSFSPFFSVKLPNFIFEDLILPDLDLCNLDDCQFQFPYLSFKFPSLRIPKIEVPPVQLDIPGVPPIEVKIAPIQFPALEFNFPQLFNLANLITPEIEMPEIRLPRPELKLTLEGIDIDLLDLLLGLFKIPWNACGSVGGITGLNISYPDYYFGWPAFPSIPEIPFCKDVRQFCRNAKDPIAEITAKTSQIQNQVNTVFQNEIQNKLDRLAEEVNQEIARKIQKELNDKIAPKIETAIIDHIAKYAGPEYAISPETGAPMPGVWPVKKELPCDKIPPLTIPMEDIVISSISLSDLLPFPDKISIDWPDSLKKITLSGKGLSYDIPPITLSKLSYSKVVNIRLPGFQLTDPSINFEVLENATACVSQPPEGGNPCQDEVNKIQANLDTIKGIKDGIKQSSQKIKDVLY